MNKLQSVAFKFAKLLKIGQQTSVQSGEIADDFPQYFPNKNQTTSPLMTKLDMFLSNLLPADVNVSIAFLVQPGFKTNFTVLFTQNGVALQNAGWAASINKFLSNEMKNFTTEASNKYKGRSVNEVLTICTHTI